MFETVYIVPEQGGIYAGIQTYIGSSPKVCVVHT